MDVVKSKSSFELLRGQMPNWCEFCPKIKPKRNPPTSSQSQLFLVTGFTNWLLGVLIFFLLKLGGGSLGKEDSLLYHVLLRGNLFIELFIYDKRISTTLSNTVAN